MDELKKSGYCCICHSRFKNYGNNAWPVKDGQCCDRCNQEFVIPERIKLASQYDFGISVDGEEVKPMEEKKTIKAILVGADDVRVIEFEDTLEQLYELLECDLIDVTIRKIGDKYFDIVVDDEGLLKENPRMSALEVTNREKHEGKFALAGNLLICNHTTGGEFASLSDTEVAELMGKEHFAAMTNPDTGELYPVVLLDPDDEAYDDWDGDWLDNDEEEEEE